MSVPILVAKRAFSTQINGAPRSVRRGDFFLSDDPVVVGREHLFAPFVIDEKAAFVGDIEQATAAPGEKRSTSIKARAAKSKTEKTPESSETDE